jgi:hypothetical protein
MTMHPNMRAFRLASPTIRRRLMILLNRWIGTMIARREREAARFMRRGELDERELQDLGIYRSQIADDLAAITQTRLRQSRRS